MSEDQSLSSESESESKPAVTPGSLLASARQEKNISLEQAAKELFVTVAKLQALERDEFDQFNSAIFVRGYLRSYAKLLKLNGDHIVALFDELLAARTPKLVESGVHALPENPQKQLWKFGAIIAGILFGIYLISVWFFDNGKSSDIKSPNVVNTALAPSIDNLPATELAVNNLSSSALGSVESRFSAVALVVSQSESSKSSVQSLSQISAGVVASKASVALQNASSISASSKMAVQVSSAALTSNAMPSNTVPLKNQRLDEINFSFREESWLEVSDSRGDVLATELQPAGSHLSLTGRAPFDVKLGNSPGVDVQLNGKKVSVTPLITTKVLVFKVAN